MSLKSDFEAAAREFGIRVRPALVAFTQYQREADAIQHAVIEDAIRSPGAYIFTCAMGQYAVVLVPPLEESTDATQLHGD